MQRGFTLIECIVSLLLLTIIMVSGMSFYFYSNGFLKMATHRMVATEIANAQMEETRHSITNSTINSTSSVLISGLTGNLSTNVTNVSGTDYKEVKIKVSWNEPGKATAQSVTLDTYMVANQ